jgi:hypothetical protein
MRVLARTFLCLCLILAGFGCGKSAEKKTSSRISVGDKMPDVETLLRASKATDITDSIGIIIGSGPLDGAQPTEVEYNAKWYELADRTGVALVFETKKGSTPLLSRIIIGEKGKGCGDKLKWLAQTQTNPTSIDLTEHS